MSKKFKWFMLSIQFGMDSGDEWSVLEFLHDFSLREELEGVFEFEEFFDVFDEFVEHKDQITFLRTEVKRLLA